MKKKRCTILFTLMLAVLAPNAALAQLDQFRNSTPEERADIQTNWMKETLELNESTTTAVADINLKYAVELQKELANGKSKMGAMRTLRKASAEKDKELESILSPDEYSRYEDNKSKLRSVMQSELKKRQSSSSAAP